ncbi:MAG: alpha-mannosidase [Lentisphaeria bacterium]|nr:alpha-mannosidase [Lentisphaeria bacterium]
MNDREFKIYRNRAEQFRNMLRNNYISDIKPLNAVCYYSKEPVAFADRLSLEGRKISEEECFGELWSNAYFHLTCEVPAAWQNSKIAVRLNLGGEIMIFDESGVPCYNLTNTSLFDPFYTKEFYCLHDGDIKNGSIDLWCEATASGLFGENESNLNGLCKTMCAGIWDEDVFALACDVEVLFFILASFEKQCARAVQTVKALDRAITVYADDRRNAAAARRELAGVLALRANDSELTAVAVGHAHIDVGWFWRVRESIRKAARTFAGQLANMDKYSDYVFGVSQPQLYMFIKEYYPELFERIKQRVREGRWELQGGMWVEPDCNIISGESMTRQFLHGKNFFMDEFGVEVKNLWLPDVFGYSASMPQIIRKSGCDYFLTQKISWSQFNKFPHHTFYWQGIDGTQVLTHFPPEDTYNSALMPERLIYARDNFSENYKLDSFMTLYGIGDGGGGPAERHIENGLRCRNFEGVPKVQFGRADKFFEQLKSKRSDLAKWVGELYLELHRGTLTTQARNKRNNRKAEQMLAALEFIYSSLPLEKYPSEILDKLWKNLLCNQFHDILPGSSINGVYKDTDREYDELFQQCRMLIENVSLPMENCCTLVNTLGYLYDIPFELPEHWGCNCAADENGNILPSQMENGKIVIYAEINAASSAKIYKTAGMVECADCNTEDLVLENEFIRYEFDRNGILLSALDKESGMEFMRNQCGNQLKLFVDVPNGWDAWDIDFTYMDGTPQTAVGTYARKVVSGNLRQILEFELEIGNSKIYQRVILNFNSRRLDFETKVDWQENKKMLRVVFDTAVNASEAECEIQYGYLKRPVHTNTSWDFARFEVAAQRYVDISDVNGGAALLNDCKYGYHLSSSALDLNLLRATTYPDPEADRGVHFFVYSFLPHGADIQSAEIAKAGALLNRKLTVIDGGSEIVPPLRIIENTGVALEAVKKAEKSNEIIVRMAENNGKNSYAVLQVDANSVYYTNLIEWEKGEEIPIVEGMIKLEFSPFEIKTIKLKQ